MYLTIENVLSTENLDKITALLNETAHWQDGKETAGLAASTVKVNQQLNQQSDEYESIRMIVEEALIKNLLFNSFTVAKKIHSILVSKTDVGGKYGEHVDNAFINGKRTDLSFTIFLNNPRDYDGGILTSDMFDGVKLNAGDAIVYPSFTLHEVTEVTRGTRLVCCGWVESRVKDPIQSDLLFDLNAAKMTLLANEGKTEVFDLVCKSHNNLLRIWSN